MLERMRRYIVERLGNTTRIVAVCVAGVLALALFGALLAMTTSRGAAVVKHPTPVSAVATASASPTSAATVTRQPTATTRPATTTAVPHPLPVPPNPPPPAHNPPPAPPQPTATARPPTPTTVPPTAGPGATGNPCPTGGCPTATPSPTATPAPPCQPGGPPYYVTPTATPTTATITQAISDAATRNGVPPLLEDAIAWQESGWQENIVACDGGIGLTQLMPATVQWLNTYYGVNDDPTTLSGNAGLGAGYLAYYYTYYIGYLRQHDASACGATGCDWDTLWPGATDGATVRDIVISVYNEGTGTMASSGIINWWYVNDVLGWMNQQPWGATG